MKKMNNNKLKNNLKKKLKNKMIKLEQKTNKELSSNQIKKY